LILIDPHVFITFFNLSRSPAP